MIFSSVAEEEEMGGLCEGWGHFRLDPTVEMEGLCEAGVSFFLWLHLNVP